VVTFVPWSAFSPWQGTGWRRRGADYEAFKDRLRERLLSQFARHRPALAARVDYAELSTPLSTDHFCRPVAGSIYGLMPTPERFRNPLLRPHAPVANLFFAGSDVATVGVMGAMMGGVLAAVAAEPAQAIAYVRAA
jgi:all-trans-retinol 13,14-reductase